MHARQAFPLLPHRCRAIFCPAMEPALRIVCRRTDGRLNGRIRVGLVAASVLVVEGSCVSVRAHGQEGNLSMSLEVRPTLKRLERYAGL